MDSNKFSGRAAQLSAINDLLYNMEWLYIEWTKSSFPVPVSPYIKVGFFDNENIFAFLIFAIISSLLVNISSNSKVFSLFFLLFLLSVVGSFALFSFKSFIEVISFDSSITPTISPFFIIGMLMLLVLNSLPLKSLNVWFDLFITFPESMHSNTELSCILISL